MALISLARRRSWRRHRRRRKPAVGAAVAVVVAEVAIGAAITPRRITWRPLRVAIGAAAGAGRSVAGDRHLACASDAEATATNTGCAVRRRTPFPFPDRETPDRSPPVTATMPTPTSVPAHISIPATAAPMPGLCRCGRRSDQKAGQPNRGEDLRSHTAQRIAADQCQNRQSADQKGSDPGDDNLCHGVTCHLRLARLENSGMMRGQFSGHA
jgi:hypothetical protein